MFFNRDAHQLAACSHSGLLEQLLQNGLDRALRDGELSPDLLVGKPLKNPFEHRLLALRKLMPAPRRSGIAGSRGYNRPRYSRIEPDFPLRHLADRLYQASWWAVLEKHTRGAVLQRAQHHGVAHARGHHQRAPYEAMVARLFQKACPLLRPEVVIQQRHIRLF